MALTEKNYWHTPDPKRAAGMTFPAGPHRGKTGRDRAGRLRYRGRIWAGPTNLMGYGRISMTDDGQLTTDATSAPRQETEPNK